MRHNNNPATSCRVAGDGVPHAETIKKPALAKYTTDGQILRFQLVLGGVGLAAAAAAILFFFMDDPKLNTAAMNASTAVSILMISMSVLLERRREKSTPNS